MDTNTLYNDEINNESKDTTTTNGDLLSIILPCHNEEQALPTCIHKIISTVTAHSLNTELLIVNNLSSDRSVEIIEDAIKNTSLPNLTIRMVHEEKALGYGAACLKGLNEAKGSYLFLADADDTYDFSDIPRFLQKIKEGNDLVLGNRFVDGITPNVMPWLHQHIGNPLLSLLVKWFFKVKISDIHCGARMISKEAFQKIVLYTTGMEFASEMVIKAAKQYLKLAEISIKYQPRIGESKLRSFRDGWRHLRFILLYSPIVLFLLPGAIIFNLGLLSMLFLYFTKIQILGISLYVHPLFLSSLLMLTGYQLVFFAAFAKIYAVTHLGDTSEFLHTWFKHITLEKACIAGAFTAAIGAIIYIFIFTKWVSSGFGTLDETKNSIVALTLIALGVQTFFSAFMLSTVGIKEK